MTLPRSREARRFYRCADRRRDEAKILIDADQPTGAVYLAGYVVEFMLKALNLEITPADRQENVLEDLKRIGHDVTKLLEFYQRKGGGRPPPNIIRAFTLVGDWSSEMRYDPREVRMPEAERFLKAVDEVYRWIDGRL